jgi:hypothetical protein
VFYDRGRYITAGGFNATDEFLASWSTMDALPDITAVNPGGGNNFAFIYSMITHRERFLQAPNYEFTQEVTDYGHGPYAHEANYHALAGSFILLSKWFNFMKERGVYDNTRIILVSDHGFFPNDRPDLHKFPDLIKLPNGDYLLTYACLLMEKDFGASGPLKTSELFSTNADVPYLATEGLIAGPIDPFTGKALRHTDESALITTSNAAMPEGGASSFDVKRGEWLQVEGDIRRPENWKLIDGQ